MSTTTIIFGATGQVGSAAALAAEKHGAKVVLAMRDTTKALPLDFSRVQADLTKPDTVSAAVSSTGAKRAFIYLVEGANAEEAKGLRPTIEAMKSAGVELVVFLSSLAVKGDIYGIGPEPSVLAWEHAQVEISLREVFGPRGYVSLRPGYFSSNLLRWADDIKQGEFKVPYPNVTWDFIAPQDIGRVAGLVLAKGIDAVDGQNAVYLCGPNMISQEDAIKTVEEVTGKYIKVIKIGDAEYLELSDRQVPRSVGEVLLKSMADRAQGRADDIFSPAVYQEGVANLEKYGGAMTTLKDWVRQNKTAFLAE
ncbi:hypothetical protein CkaCkLH20_09457 [Colletotrichum karsti]|uniref:NmrA-like domain-containing protein n=1 Tax=Colletotrichum karsti TaxID=1095194 RepID=A0A9P6HZD3_9PEZI|nr:uncharacterized protein CkaCkLH20_09457 [Colletotrichum karsti]KAF9872947.1 hypothetical protein CkaCkLH20_09457 [Colletotrichum karsti]